MRFIEPRILISGIIGEMISVWREIVANSGINLLLHALAFIVDVFILLILVFRWIEKRKIGKGEYGFMLAFFIILAETAAIILFMPEGRATYLYPMLYASYLTIFLFMLYSLNRGDLSEL